MYVSRGFSFVIVYIFGIHDSPYLHFCAHRKVASADSCARASLGSDGPGASVPGLGDRPPRVSVGTPLVAPEF